MSGQAVDDQNGKIELRLCLVVGQSPLVRSIRHGGFPTSVGVRREW